MIHKASVNYQNVPSWKLVLILKDCKKLLDSRPDYSVQLRERLKNTIKLLRNILIQRQVLA